MNLIPDGSISLVALPIMTALKGLHGAGTGGIEGGVKGLAQGAAVGSGIGGGGLIGAALGRALANGLPGGTLDPELGKNLGMGVGALSGGLLASQPFKTTNKIKKLSDKQRLEALEAKELGNSKKPTAEKLGQVAANSFIEKAAFFSSLPAPAQAALLQGGLGALLGGGLGGIKGLISPDEEIDEEGNPTGKRKSRLSSALRYGGIGAAAGGALGAFRGAAKSYMDGKRNEITSARRAADPGSRPEPKTTETDNKPKPTDSGDGKPLLRKNRGKAPVFIPSRKPEGNSGKMDYDALGKAKLKYMADPDMSDYIKSEEKDLELQKDLAGYGYSDSERKAKIIENTLTSPTALDMVYRQKLLDKAILNADRNAFIGRNYDPITKNPQDYITAYPKGKYEYSSEIGNVPYDKTRAREKAETQHAFETGSHALPPTPEMDRILSIIEDRLRAPRDRKFEYGPTTYKN
jgi:hypothetical protein